MNLQEMLDDIEKVCQSCDACEPSCAAHVMKTCIQSEIEHENLLKL